ncbi:hypothetical protein JHK82_017926 [Glycine max]|nr:hypothetical protein JHK82_017926 [Glycine max]
MLNTEVGAVLAVIRRPKFTPLYNIPSSEDSYTTLPSSVPYDPFALSFSTFNKNGAPSALSSVLKILKFEVFDDKSPGFGGCRDDEDIASLDGDNAPQGFGFASGSICLHPRRHVLSTVATHATESADRLSKSGCANVAVATHCAKLLAQHSSMPHVVQQSATRGDLLQRSARYTMHELIQVVFARLTEIEPKDREGDSESGMEDGDEGGGLESGYVEADGSTSHTADEDVQIFALVLINSATELSGDEIGKRPKLLRMIQDDLFHHLIYYILDMVKLLCLVHDLQHRVECLSLSPKVRDVSRKELTEASREFGFIYDPYAHLIP